MNRRYLRHFALFGKAGQHALLDSKVLVIGAGGLGCFVLYNIAAAGIGKIGIVDFDRVSVSDLNRQILYDINSINQLKVDAAKKKLQEFNPDCKIEVYNSKIQDIADIINSYEIVADCCDNFKTRFFINKVCYQSRKILISAAVARYGGYVITIKAYLGGQHPCYCCFCPKEPSGSFGDSSCEGVGVLGAAVSVIGGLQANQIIQEVLQVNKQDLPGQMIRADILDGRFHKLRIARDEDCVFCGRVTDSKFV